jgi:hypothetical protein
MFLASFMKVYRQHECTDFADIRHDALCWCLALIKIICIHTVSSCMCWRDIIVPFFLHKLNDT